MNKKTDLTIAATTRRGLAALALSLIFVAAMLPRPLFAEQQQPALAPAAAAKGPTVFAAASMKTALDAVAAAWTAETGKIPANRLRLLRCIGEADRARCPSRYFHLRRPDLDGLSRKGQTHPVENAA